MPATDNLNTLYQHAPLVLAHRGASHDAPQNTVAAFTLARQLGADGVELDTSLTRDGIPVVIHDLTLDKTTNGAGSVRNHDLKTIKTLDAGQGQQVPTLDEAFKAIGPDLVVNVELKSESWLPNGLERPVLEVIRRHNAGRVIISSFNPFALRRFRALAPDIPIGYLYSPEEPLYMRAGWFLLGMSYEAQHPKHTMIDAAYMARAKQRGYRVNTWTVDDPDRIIALRALGVDTIITNRPDVALQALGRTPRG